MHKAMIFSIFLILTAMSLFVACDRKGEKDSGNGNDIINDDSENNDQVQVDIFYLPHPPAEAIVREVEALLKEYPSITINEYDFLDPENKQKIEDRGLTEHMPVAIFIDNDNTFVIEGKTIIFSNFPIGDAFVPTQEGSWSYDDLEKVIESR